MLSDYKKKKTTKTKQTNIFKKKKTKIISYKLGCENYGNKY